MASVGSSPTGPFSLRRIARETRARPWLTNSKLVGRRLASPSSDAPDVSSPRRAVVVASAAASRFASRLPVLAARTVRCLPGVGSSEVECGSGGRFAGSAGDSASAPASVGCGSGGRSASNAGDSASACGSASGSASASVVVAALRGGSDTVDSLAATSSQRRRTRLGLRLKDLGRRAVDWVMGGLSRVGCEKPPGARASRYFSRRPRDPGSTPAKGAARALRPGVKRVTFAENVVICPVDCDAARDSILCELCGVPCGEPHENEGCEALMEIDPPGDLVPAKKWAKAQRQLLLDAYL